MGRNTEDLTLRMRAAGASPASREVRRLRRELNATRKGANQTRGSLRLFTNGMRPMASIATGAAGALGVLGLGGALSVMVSEGRESVKVGNQTNAVLNSTRRAANVTASGVESLANAISLKTGIDDEQIQTAENLLLTFTGIRNEVGKNNKVFDRATQAVTDMSVAMRTPLKNAAVLVGKALQDPIRGATALRRVGVALTDQQAEQIRTLVESGQKLRAQKIILRELNKEFGGSAAAQADSLDKLNVAWRNLAEAGGKLLLPVVATIATALTGLVLQVQTGTGAGGELRDIVVEVAGQLKTLGVWVYENRDAIEALGGAALGAYVAFRLFLIFSRVMTLMKTGLVLWKAWRAGTLAATAAQLGFNAVLLANPIGLIVVAIGALIGALVLAYMKVDWFRNGVDTAFGAIKSVVKTAVDFVKAIWPTVWSVLKWTPMVVGLRVAFAAIKGIFTGQWDGLMKIITDGMNMVIDVINVAIDAYNKVPFHGDVGHVGHIGEGSPDRSVEVARGAAVTRIMRNPLEVASPFARQPTQNIASDSREPDIVLHHETLLDGKVIAKSTHRQGVKRKATR